MKMKTMMIITMTMTMIMVYCSIFTRRLFVRKLAILKLSHNGMILKKITVGQLIYTYLQWSPCCTG